MKDNPHGEVAIDMMQLDSVPLAEHLVPRRKQAPEYELIWAVLQDALDCVEKYRFAADAHGRRRFREAKQWFLADEIDSPYSFRWVSKILDLDSNAIRQRLRVAPKQRTSLRAAPVMDSAMTGRLQIWRLSPDAADGMKRPIPCSAEYPSRPTGCWPEELYSAP